MQRSLHVVIFNENSYLCVDDVKHAKLLSP